MTFYYFLIHFQNLYKLYSIIKIISLIAFPLTNQSLNPYLMKTTQIPNKQSAPSSTSTSKPSTVIITNIEHK